MRLQRNFNNLSNDEQLHIIMEHIKYHEVELAKLKKISRKLVMSNVSIKVEERPDEFKEVEIKNA